MNDPLFTFPLAGRARAQSLSRSEQALTEQFLPAFASRAERGETQMIDTTESTQPEVSENELTANELRRLRSLLASTPRHSDESPTAITDRLVESVYRAHTRYVPEGRAFCSHCGLESHTAPGRVIRHMRTCELAQLYERAGGQVEFRGGLLAGG